jgi:hypothetical protein
VEEEENEEKEGLYDGLEVGKISDGGIRLGSVVKRGGGRRGDGVERVMENHEEIWKTDQFQAHSKYTSSQTQ